MKRGIAALALAVAASWVSVASAGWHHQVSPAKPLPPQAAQAAIDAVGQHSASVHQVSVAEAMQAAHRPGAVTEGSLGARRLASALGTLCFSGSVSAKWGTWPYDQHVTDHTYWCAVYGGYITYRSTYVTHSGSLCSGSGDYSFRINGGVNYQYVYYESGAYFNCPTTIPWVNVNRHDWLHILVDAWGSLTVVQQS